MHQSDWQLKTGYVILLFFITVQGALLYNYIHSMTTSKNWIIHTHKVIEELESLYSNLKDEEDGLLGIMGSLNASKGAIASNKLTANHSALTSGEQSSAVVRNVKNLLNLIQDNPSQKHRLSELNNYIQQDIQFWEKATSSVKPTVASPYIVQIRDKVKEMIAVENNLLSLRNAQHNKIENGLVCFLAISSVVTYFLLFAVIVLLHDSRKKLTERENRLNLAVRGTSDGLWDWDPRTNDVYYSPRLKAILGFKDNEMANTLDAFTSLIHQDDVEKVWQEIGRHLKDRVPYDVIFRMRKKDDSVIWVELRGQAIWEDGTVPIRMSGFLTDITQRKEAEQIKNEFVSTVSHELRTPLTSIRGSLGLILSGVGGKVSEKTHNLVEVAHKNCERLILLINDILDVEKLESGKIRFDLKWQSLKSVIEQAIELNRAFGEKYQVQFKIQQPLLDAKVYVDNERLIQVLTNLLSNAAKFSPANSTVEIATKIVDQSIRTIIKDAGPGIPTEFRDRIFSKFAQADSSVTKKTGGTGLGLSISKAIVEQFGGKIGFSSEASDGTTFYFDLPITYTQEVALSNNETNEKLRILICEDDKDVAYLLRDILQQHDYIVDIAFTASQARKLLNTHTYAALTLDLILPDENGINLIQEIRSQVNFLQLPIIVISVEAEKDHKILNGQALGVVDWLTKPIDRARLISVLGEISARKKKPALLYVEDDADLAKIVTISLKDYGKVLHAATIEQAKKILEQKEVDLVMLDITLPDGCGLKLLEMINEKYPKPVIIFSASEVSSEVRERVRAALVKSRNTEEEFIAAIKFILAQQEYESMRKVS